MLKDTVTKWPVQKKCNNVSTTMYEKHADENEIHISNELFICLR